VTVALTPPDGLKFSTTKFSRKDLVDPEAKDPQLKTTFQATGKGAQRVRSEVGFLSVHRKNSASA